MTDEIRTTRVLVNDFAPLGFTFTETMGGYMLAGEHDHWSAERFGRRLGERLRFVVTVTIQDLAAFLADARHQAVLTGTVEGSRVGGRVRIEPGTFNLFARDGGGRLQMRYCFSFLGRHGRRYRLDGIKDIHNDRIVDVWPDTTTLFTTLRREDEPGEPVAATGILRIRPIDLIPQVRSMRALHARSARDHARAVARFNLFFAGQLLDEYLLSLFSTARPHPRRGAKR
jgi:cholesterol oxidase